MNYSIIDFNKDFPNDDVCLSVIFNNRYGNLDACPMCGIVRPKFYKVTSRKCYACKDCGGQLHPLANTIFHKSDTPLTKWFFAIYLFSVSKNGVSAKEIERALGVTYKCAHRIAQRVRMLMQQCSSPLNGIVEADETYIGGKRHRHDVRGDNKTAVIGLAQRKGEARAIVADATASVVIPSFKRISRLTRSYTPMSRSCTIVCRATAPTNRLTTPNANMRAARSRPTLLRVFGLS